MTASLELAPIPEELAATAAPEPAKRTRRKKAEAEPPVETPQPEPQVAPPAQAVSDEDAGNALMSMVENMIVGGANAETLTNTYLRLRAAKKENDARLSAKNAPITSALNRIESHFLDLMNTMGVDSLKNGAGTPYKSTTTSITMGDNQSFVDFVLDTALVDLPVSDEAKGKIKEVIHRSGALAMMEARPSKSAITAYMEGGNELPPGLVHRAEVKVNVKSS